MKKYQEQRFYLYQNVQRNRQKQNYSNSYKNAPLARPQDRQLYQLCQQLTHQNRLLKRQLSQLTAITHNQQDKGLNFISQYQKQDYRQLNYDNYKKKGMQIMQSLRLLYNLYYQKKKTQQKDHILDTFLHKIKTGNANNIQQLIVLYNEVINKQNQSNQLWDIDELQKYASQYHNNMLRRHISKLNDILIQTVAFFKKDLCSIKQDWMDQKKMIKEVIKNQCQRLVKEKYYVGVTGGKEKNEKHQKNDRNEKQEKIQKNKKKNKKYLNENEINLQNIKHKTKTKKQQSQTKNHSQIILDQSLQLINRSHQLMPLSFTNTIRPSIPKPRKQSYKYQNILLDQINSSKCTQCYVVTPKSIVKKHSLLKTSKTEHNNEKSILERKISKEKDIGLKKSGKRRISQCR